MKWVLCALLVLHGTPLAPGLREKNGWRIWNVGQGLWTTHVSPEGCLHLDAGGERKPVKRIRSLCEGKENVLVLSHWDWDHIGGVAALKAALPNLCLLALPGGKAKSAKRAKSVRALPFCPRGKRSLHFVSWNQNARTSNHASHVAVWKNEWLFPGDSPATEEKKWRHRLPRPEKIRVLLAGHHGSKTSTSKELLSSLPSLRLVIVSARRKVYGHPHPLVVRRLEERGVPMLRTEDWGHLLFEENFP